MKFEFKKASKKKSKLRCAIFGPSGSGKTYSSLMIASALGTKIAVIDTERGSASKYSSKLDFDVLDLNDATLDNYILAINRASNLGYEVLIIDSLSHGWHSLLEEMNRVAKSKFNGNTWSAWNEGTPKQKRLIESLLAFNGHVIATMRSKTEWVQETYTDREGRSKSKPVMIGLTPEQGKGIEYEFDLLLQISNNHCAEVIKDRTEKFQDQVIEKPGKEFGLQLLAWLNEGESATLITPEQLERFNELTSNLQITEEKISAGLKMKGFNSPQEMTQEAATFWIKSLEERLATLKLPKETPKEVVNNESCI